MKKFFAFTLILIIFGITLGIFVNSRKDSLDHLLTYSVCDQPISYKVDTVDPKFNLSEDNFKAAKCNLLTLSNYDTLVKQAVKSKYITEKDMKSLQEWRNNPSEWGK